jgi:hypothetical protein
VHTYTGKRLTTNEFSFSSSFSSSIETQITKTLDILQV